MTALSKSAPLRAIRRNCLECVGGSWRLVETCASKTCNMYPFRFGSNPELAPRKVSKAQTLNQFKPATRASNN